MAKKKTKLSLWKLSLTIGLLLGIGIKIWDYINAGYLRCGVFSPAEQCTGIFQYLGELPVWAVLGIMVSFVFIYGGRYTLIHGFHLVKNFKIPDVEFVDDEDSSNKKKLKKEKSKNTKEEKIKVSDEESKSKDSSQKKDTSDDKKEKKVIKI